MPKCIFYILFFLVTTSTSYTQNPFELGAEYMRSFGRGHSGNRAGIRAETFQNKNSFSAGLIYLFSSSKSYSASKGFGLYAGYRYSFSNNVNDNSPFVGARVSFSFENFEGKTFLNSLMTTPMAEVGYHMIFGEHVYTAPSIGYGYTIKITREHNSLDEDVGKRFLPSISAGYRF